MLSILGFIIFSTYVSYLGVCISRLFPWKNDVIQRICYLPWVFGLGLGPFLLGFANILLLSFAPGLKSSTYLYALCCLLLFVHSCILLLTKINKNSLVPIPKFTSYFGYNRRIALSILIIFFPILLVFFSACYFPLIQNDSLEYMTIARQLFFTHSLFSYPMLNQEPTQSGFFGPFTHPPLYVVLLFFNQLLQGHANYPGISRLITPWIFSLVTLQIFTLGAVRNYKVAVLASLMLMSAPLYFLGAIGGLIDSLPVLGYTLVITLAFGLNERSFYFPIVLGLIVGCALWTHSEAVLIIPISCLLVLILNQNPGVKRFTDVTKKSLLLVFVSLVIAIWPYLKNWRIFHAVVSDNPLVFQLPKLDWENYFTIGRGLGTLNAKIQYGLLKGFFCYEALGFLFWFLLIGMLGLFVLRGKNNCDNLVRKLLIISMAIILAFHLIVVASMVGNLSVIIKNERYFLIIISAVSIAAALSLESMYSFFVKKQLSRMIIKPFATAIVFIFYMIFFYLSYTFQMTYLSSSDWFNFSNSIKQKLLVRLPRFGVIFKASAIIPFDAIVYAQSPSVMYYLPNKIISYLDPRLEKFYSSQSMTEALNELHRLGVRYIQTTDYTLPTHYNSLLNDICADPAETQLLVNYMGNSVYELKKTHAKLKNLNQFDNFSHLTQWSCGSRFNYLGRKTTNFRYQAKNTESLCSESMGIYNHRINDRMWTHFFLSPIVTLDVNPGDELMVKLRMKGWGHFRASFLEFDSLGQPVNYESIHHTYLPTADFVLSDNSVKKTIASRFVARTNHIQISIELFGSGHIEIDSLNFYKIKSTN